MFAPDRYYIFEPDKWDAQQFSPLQDLSSKVTERGETALAAHRDGKIVAYRAHNKFIRLRPVPAWREVND